MVMIGNPIGLVENWLHGLWDAGSIPATTTPSTTTSTTGADSGADTGAKTTLCPRGNQYVASQTDLWLGCDSGYNRPLGGDFCQCAAARAAAAPPLDGESSNTIYYIIGAVILFLLLRR